MCLTSKLFVRFEVVAERKAEDRRTDGLRNIFIRWKWILYYLVFKIPTLDMSAIQFSTGMPAKKQYTFFENGKIVFLNNKFDFDYLFLFIFDPNSNLKEPEDIKS